MDLVQLLKQHKAPSGWYVSLKTGPNTKTEIVEFLGSGSATLDTYTPVSRDDEMKWLQKKLGSASRLYLEIVCGFETIPFYPYKKFRICNHGIQFY